MLKCIALGSFMLSASIAAASPAVEICPLVGEVSYYAMVWRQAGVELSDVMTMVHNSDSFTPETSGLLQSIVLAAYSTPLVHSDEARIAVTAEFKNQIEKICYEAALK